jgi:hypothetical protein
MYTIEVKSESITHPAWVVAFERNGHPETYATVDDAQEALDDWLACWFRETGEHLSATDYRITEQD